MRLPSGSKKEMSIALPSVTSCCNSTPASSRPETEHHEFESLLEGPPPRARGDRGGVGGAGLDAGGDGTAPASAGSTDRSSPRGRSTRDHPASAGSTHRPDGLESGPTDGYVNPRWGDGRRVLAPPCREREGDVGETAQDIDPTDSAGGPFEDLQAGSGPRAGTREVAALAHGGEAGLALPTSCTAASHTAKVRASASPRGRSRAMRETTCGESHSSTRSPPRRPRRRGAGATVATPSPHRGDRDRSSPRHGRACDPTARTSGGRTAVLRRSLERSSVRGPELRPSRRRPPAPARGARRRPPPGASAARGRRGRRRPRGRRWRRGHRSGRGRH